MAKELSVESHACLETRAASHTMVPLRQQQLTAYQPDGVASQHALVTTEVCHRRRNAD